MLSTIPYDPGSAALMARYSGILHALVRECSATVATCDGRQSVTPADVRAGLRLALKGAVRAVEMEPGVRV